MQRPKSSQYQFESLEDRQLLTASPGGHTPAPAEAIETTHELQVMPVDDLTSDSTASALERNQYTDAIVDLDRLEGTYNGHDYVGRYDVSDLYRFQIGDRSSVDIAIEGLWGDANLYLLDENHQTLHESTNRGTQSEQIHVELDTGEYFVLVSRYRRHSTNYDLNITSKRLSPPLDVQDQIQDATDIGVLSGEMLVKDSVNQTEPMDFVRFELLSHSEVEVGIRGESPHTQTRLYSSTGELIEQPLNLENPGSGDVAYELAPGTYYVSVESTSNLTTFYELELRSTPIDAGLPGELNRAKDVGVLDGELLVKDSVNGEDSADFFRFELLLHSEVEVGIRGASPNTETQLYSMAGELISTSTADSEGDETSHQLPPGTYYAAVVSTSNLTTFYELELRATPAGSDPSRSETKVPETAAALPEVDFYGDDRHWSANLVQAPEAWAAGYTGTDIVVAVVDTGIQLDHDQLAGGVWQNTDEIAGDGIDNDLNGYVDDRFGWDFISPGDLPHDDNGHGTHVAGTIAALRDGHGSTGVSYDAEVMAVRVLDDEGRGSLRGVAKGIRYAVDNGADIINLSLGGDENRDVLEALEYAQEHDVLVVVAAGNDGASQPGYPARYSASLSNVISVGAFGDGLARASFSNNVGDSGAVQVDAPGVSIYSTKPNQTFGHRSGTSMAAPHVSAVAALTLSANPQLTSAELRSVLTQGADTGATGSDAAGIVNAANSIVLALGYVIDTTDSSLSFATTNGIPRSTEALLDKLPSAAPEGEDGSEATPARNLIQVIREIARDLEDGTLETRPGVGPTTPNFELPMAEYEVETKFAADLNLDANA